MSIAKKKNRRFFTYSFSHNGKRYRGSTKETSKTAARHFETQLIAKLDQGYELPVRGRRAPLLRDFLPQFLASFETNQLRAEATKSYYRAGAVLLKASALAEFPIDRITTSIVAGAKFPHSGSNANNAIRTLRRALTHGVELGYLRAVPTFHLHQEIAREAIFTAEQEVALLAKAEQPLADVFVLCMDMGMRPEEVCRIRWDDVQWAENMLRITDGKTKAAKRTIGMSERVVEILRRRIREQSASKRSRDSVWAFPSRVRRGSDQHIVSVNKAFRIARKEAGLPDDLVLYSARHTFGTEFMAASKNLKLTMTTMGHVDVKTAMRYQHPETGQVSDIMNARNAQRKSVTTVQGGHTFGHTVQIVQ